MPDTDLLPQFARLILASSVLTPEDISQRLGLAPHLTATRGSRSVDPVRPVSNLWELRASDIDSSLATQIDELLGVVRASRNEISQALSEPGTGGSFQIVRYLKRMVDLRLDSSAVGLHLDNDDLAMIVGTGLDLDLDEYL